MSARRGGLAVAACAALVAAGAAVVVATRQTGTDPPAGSAPPTSATAIVATTARGVPPVATDDAHTRQAPGGPVVFDVLANDTDPDGDASQLLVRSARVASGSATVTVSDRAVRLLPDPAFVGVITAEYTVVDPDGLTATATIQLDIVEIAGLGLGDAVMASAANELRDRGYTVHASVSQKFVHAALLAGDLDVTGVLDDYSTVIVHLGNNGPIVPADLDALLDALAATPEVILLTDHVQRDWVDANNEMIVAAGRRPNVTVLDWAWLAADCPGACFAGDLTLSTDGATYYADRIDDAAGR